MEILLDTVTVSELRKAERMDISVKAWQAAIGGRPVYLSVITMNEIRFGIGKLENRDPEFAELLKRWYSSLISQSELFRLIDVNLSIAEQAADYRCIHGLSYDDSLIAATAEIHGLVVATRNVSDFEKSGVRIVNPWEYAK
ncbi:MAG: type II toxin-antitoxin system VapC family toxin [Akkermansiaceae bacterium]|jgi:toxin FitB|nr:type II toxin-antitoxin system VapC family toxin [Akkermansiaceae bacterium]MDP4645736.1 type II toxin-antitoxin system VapC family toxin [Akkermansiaceae bacterium]MDP4720578.1 type II toxin-antitoxin system VapC family toxin [Akkermansiaceae bacterium]MDP4781493.1 type II toxin-antitoxin system VapC family toxin [Akkermansiaceae bacterium]MDP4847596.1 type II toxin-antitoxin system VapC family toxin [Akkermansiaceae bacterium]